MKWIVEIVEYDTGRIERAIDCESARRAERVEDGVNINLNHANLQESKQSVVVIDSIEAVEELLS